MKMKLYLITAPNGFDGCDTYDSAVVSAKSKKDARKINPSCIVTHVSDGEWKGTYNEGGEYDLPDNAGWIGYPERDQLGVEYLGNTKKERGVILASFNAG